MKILRYIAPYLIQVACIAPLAVYMSQIRPPIKEEIFVGFYIIGYFVACGVILLPASVWHMFGVWKSRASHATRLVLVLVALSNLAISMWMPRLVWKIVGFEKQETAQQTPGVYRLLRAESSG